jgi:hypothetical protein
MDFQPSARSTVLIPGEVQPMGIARRELRRHNANREEQR